jgi:spermidine/putrescine transport system permease protein
MEKKINMSGGLYGKVLSAAFIILVYLFLYVPIFVLIFFSFNKEAFPAPWSGFTWDWYIKLWHDSDPIWHAFYNSLIVSISATFISLIMATILMFYITQNVRFKKFLNIFYGNLLVPEIVLAVGLLSFFSFCEIPLGKITLIIAHTVLGLGYAVPILQIRYRELDQRLIEASLDLGASYFQTFKKVILPLLKPALLVSGLLVFVISFDDFVLSYFCAGITAQTLPIHILSMLRTGVSPVVNALSTGLIAISSLFVIIAVRMKIF